MVMRAAGLEALTALAVAEQNNFFALHINTYEACCKRCASFLGIYVVYAIYCNIKNKTVFISI